MKTDIDTCLKDIADFYIKNRRSMTEPELESIVKKHVESEAEAEKFVKFVETEPGQLRFKTLLRERKETSTLKETEKPTPGVTGVTGLVDIGRLKDLPNVKISGSYAIGTAKEGSDVDILVGLTAKEWAKVTPSKPPAILEKIFSVLPEDRLDIKLYELSKPSELWYFRRRKVIGTKGTSGVFVPVTEKSLAEELWKIAKPVEAVEQKPSYLKETVTEPETECQLISPQYYDILGWFNIPVPDYSFSIEPEAKERKIDEVLQKLKDGVARIHESAIFREFLTTMSKFWEYSFGNQILIMFQRSGATRVAGFNTWKDLGRYVKAGERGIAILAPCLPPKELRCPICGQVFTERELRTHLSAVHHREDVSKLVREAQEAMVVPTPTYFKVVYVFDVSQTEGKPLPEIAVPVLSGAFSKELYDKLMALASKQSLTVSSEPKPGLSPEIKGSFLGKTIWVKGDEPEAQRLKTLAHEEAHYFTEAVYFIPRAEAEVIAESVAFVVCAHFGFDSGIRSFPYVALWAKEKKVLEQNLASIRKISGRMIEELG